MPGVQMHVLSPAALRGDLAALRDKLNQYCALPDPNPTVVGALQKRITDLQWMLGWLEGGKEG